MAFVIFGQFTRWQHLKLGKLKSGRKFALFLSLSIERGSEYAEQRSPALAASAYLGVQGFGTAPLANVRGVKPGS